MRDYAQFKPAFWTQGTGKRLRGNPFAQALAPYLSTSPFGSMTGLFYLPFATMLHDLGWSEEELRATLKKLQDEDFAYYDEEAALVYLPSGLRTQTDDVLAPGDKRIRGIVRELRAFRRHRFCADLVRRYAETHHLAAHTARHFWDAPSDNSEAPVLCSALLDVSSSSLSPSSEGGAATGSIPSLCQPDAVPEERPSGIRPTVPAVASALAVEPPRPRVRPTDPGLEPYLAQAWADGIALARGGTPIVPERGERRDLAAVVQAAAPPGLSAEDLLTWLRDDAKVFADVEPNTPNVFRYRDWVRGGRKVRAKIAKASRPGRHDEPMADWGPEGSPLERARRDAERRQAEGGSDAVGIA